MTKRRTVVLDSVPLNPTEQRFCIAYVETGNSDAEAAWLSTFGQFHRNLAPADKRAKAKKESARLLRRSDIQDQIARIVRRMERVSRVKAIDVIERLATVAFTDPREIVRYEYVNCRHCWGKNFRYQWTVGEWDTYLAKKMDEWLRDPKNEGKKFVAPECEGGVGFDGMRAPHPDCPECYGRGEGDVVITDTRDLSRGAAALLAGIKHGKFGVEVSLHSSLDALKELAKVFGLTPERVTLLLEQRDGKEKGPGVPSLEGLTMRDAVEAYQAFMSQR